MKILCAEYNAEKEAAIVPIGDDALLRNNGDFYVPEFTREVSCVPQWVVRICKLGKTVSERFACRYYEEIGAGIRFYADTLENELEKKSLPAVMAASFDSSAAISGLIKAEKGRQAVLMMRINGQEVYRMGWNEQPVSVERLISLASVFHTLKIGDFLYCGAVFRYRGIKIGDRIQLSLGDNQLLDFQVK